MRFAISDDEYFPLTALSLLVEAMVSYEARVGEEWKSRRVDCGSGECQELVKCLSFYADPCRVDALLAKRPTGALSCRMKGAVAFY